MKPKGNELVAGLFVLLMLFAFLVFLSWQSGGIARWNAPQKHAVTWFHSIGGLKEKQPVVYQGLPIGEVRSIDFDTAHWLIRVTMTVDSSFILPGRGVAIITAASLLGDPYVEITNDFTYLDTRALVRGDERIYMKNGYVILDALDPSSYGQLLMQGSALLAKIDARFVSFADTIGQILTGADLLVADERFRADIHATAANARFATARLPGTLSRADELVGAASSAAGRVDRILARSEDSVARIVGNADEVAVNARVLTYGLTEAPWRLVWKDPSWQQRVQSRDPALLSASLQSGETGSLAAPRATGTAAQATGGSDRTGPPHAYTNINRLGP